MDGDAAKRLAQIQRQLDALREFMPVTNVRHHGPPTLARAHSVDDHHLFWSSAGTTPTLQRSSNSPPPASPQPRVRSTARVSRRSLWNGAARGDTAVGGGLSRSQSVAGNGWRHGAGIDGEDDPFVESGALATRGYASIANQLGSPRRVHQAATATMSPSPEARRARPFQPEHFVSTPTTSSVQDDLEQDNSEHEGLLMRALDELLAIRERRRPHRLHAASVSGSSWGLDGIPEDGDHPSLSSTVGNIYSASHHGSWLHKQESNGVGVASYQRRPRAFSDGMYHHDPAPEYSYPMPRTYDSSTQTRRIACRNAATQTESVVIVSQRPATPKSRSPGRALYDPPPSSESELEDILTDLCRSTPRSRHGGDEHSQRFAVDGATVNGRGHVYASTRVHQNDLWSSPYSGNYSPSSSTRSQSGEDGRHMHSGRRHRLPDIDISMDI